MDDSIEEGPQDDQETCADARPNDEVSLSIATITASIKARSKANRQASENARGDRDDVSALLGLEPANTEKAGENPAIDGASIQQARLAPLLGTTLLSRSAASSGENLRYPSR